MAAKSTVQASTNRTEQFMLMVLFGVDMYEWEDAYMMYSEMSGARCGFYYPFEPDA